MEEHGLIYASARNRLRARLGDVEHDLFKLKEALEPLKESQVVPAASQFEALGRRLNKLDNRRPLLREPLAHSDRLDALASAAVENLSEEIATLRLSAGTLDGAPLPTEPSEIRDRARAALDALTKAQRSVAFLTVAYDTRDALVGLRVGKALSFDDMFKERIPSIEDRTSILEQLSQHTGEYLEDGIVDIPGRKIWRKSTSQAVRILTYLSPIAFAVLAWLVLWVVSALDFPAEWNLGDASELLEAYALVLLGALAHLAVENVKQHQAGTIQVTAIGDFLDWLHLRWQALAVSFFHILVTVLGLRILGVGTSEQDALLYFFAGYSVDSVAGVLLTRFGTTASSGVARAAAAVASPQQTQQSQ